MSFRRRQLKKLTEILFFLYLLVFLTPPYVRASDYAFVSSVFKTYDYLDTSTGGTLLSLGDDAVSSPLPLGFTFSYYGKDYTEILVGSNGLIGFPTDSVGLASATQLPAIPDPADPNAVIAPLATDLDPSAGGSIYTLSGGIPGKRYFVVEWIGVPVKGQGGNRTFEAVLYEDNGDILFQYKTLRGGGPITASTTTIGIENRTGDGGLFPADLSLIREGTSILFSETDPDADGDGMIDRFEDFYGLDSAADDAGSDLDSDGLTNLAEYQAGTKPNQADTDADGILDGADADPLDSDADQDGLRDAREDTNLDGNLDTGESDPSSPDTDGDGFTDSMEITFGSDPLDALSIPKTGYTMVSGSVQTAVDSASEGDILYLPPGTYTGDLTLGKAVTLIGAGPRLTFLQGRITLGGGSGTTLTALTVEMTDTGTNPAIRVLGDPASDTSVHLVNITLLNCVNGLLVSDASDGGAATRTSATLDHVTFQVDEAKTVGYGIKVEELQDPTDQVKIRNTSLSLNGAGGAIVIQGSRNVTVTGSTISNAETSGIVITDSTTASAAITLDNNWIRDNFGAGIEVGGNGTGIVLNRDTLSGNSGSGIRITGSASVTITDNLVSGNQGYGMESSSSPSVTNSGNSVTDNTLGAYSNSNVFQTGETAADPVGASSTGRLIAESAAFLRAGTGGTVAFITPPDVLTDPIRSLFGTGITIGASTISEDTVVTIYQSTETLPALPVSFNYAMPVAEFRLENGDLTGTASITLPVLASYDTDTARVFHLTGGVWKEMTPLTPVNHQEIALHQQVSFSTNSLSPFALVISLPFLDSGDPGGGAGGCSVSTRAFPRGKTVHPLDPLLWLFPLIFPVLKRNRARSTRAYEAE